MKKLLSLLLALTMCLSAAIVTAVTDGVTASAASAHVYMIVTNPGEDMNTQMNISWHADYTYTGCFVQYTTASDTSFAKAKTVSGTYDSEDYTWFYNRLIGSSTTSRFGTMFLNYGAELTDLTPNTDYIYRIGDGTGGYSETYAFKTGGQTNFSIMWLSDMHLSGNSSKSTKYASAINYVESIAKYDIGLYFNTGDVVSCGDRYTWWQEFYGFDVMKKYTYASTVGNHDLYDSVMITDTAYTQYWKSGIYYGITSNYPKNSYVQTSARINGYLNSDGYSAYASQASDRLVTVDSGNLAGKQITGAKEDLNGRTYWFLYNRILFICFDYFAMTNASEKNTAFEWAYDVIEQNKGKYDYLVATEHLNLIWGDEGTSRYYDEYKNFLDTANIDLFIAGDNHIYFRTDKLLNGEVTTDPEKGTYIVQAPAVTNTTKYPDYSGSYGYGVNRYAAADYLGGIVIDVDSTGMHFQVAVGTKTGADMSVYDTFTIPKKTRYSDIATGIYTAQSDLAVRETSDASAQSLTVIPSGTVFEVTAGDGVWARVRFNGYTGWVNLGGYSADYYTTDVTVPELFEISTVNVGYSSSHLVNAYTPAYGSTIANGGWQFSGQVTITGVRDDTGAYKVTEQNTGSEAKNTTAIPANGCVLLINKNYGSYASLMSTLSVGSYFTLDTNGVKIYTAAPGEANVTPTIPGTVTEPDSLTLVDGSDYSLGEYVKLATLGTTVADFSAQFVNDDLRVFDLSGNQLSATDIVGTGFTVKCYSSASILQESKQIAVAGDVDCDGNITTSDLLLMKSYLKSSVSFTAVCTEAADYNLDGSADVTDYTYYVYKLSR